MALTPDQLTLVAEIVRESYASVVSTTSSLNPSQESLLSDDVDLWEAERNSVDFKMKGGRDGIVLDSSETLRAIFYRVRNMLGFSLIPYDQSEPVISLMELEVGQNFG
jgi:hypothetical protein